jgi:hypothetical protein
MQYHPWRWGGLWGEIGYRAVSFSYGGDSVSGPTWLGVNYTTLGGGVEAATDLGVGRYGPGLVRLFGNVGIRIGSAGANRLETFRYRDTADGGEPVVASFGAGARSEDSPLAGVWWLGFGAGATVALGGRLGLRMDAAYELGLVDIFRDLGPDVQAPRPNLFALRIGIVALYGDAPGE